MYDSHSAKTAKQPRFGPICRRAASSGAQMLPVDFEPSVILAPVERGEAGSSHDLARSTINEE